VGGSLHTEWESKKKGGMLLAGELYESAGAFSAIFLLFEYIFFNILHGVSV
jgi:hypothetical protein